MEGGFLMRLLPWVTYHHAAANNSPLVCQAGLGTGFFGLAFHSEENRCRNGSHGPAAPTPEHHFIPQHLPAANHVQVLPELRLWGHNNLITTYVRRANTST